MTTVRISDSIITRTFSIHDSGTRIILARAAPMNMKRKPTALERNKRLVISTSCRRLLGNENEAFEDDDAGIEGFSIIFLLRDALSCWTYEERNADSKTAVEGILHR